MTFSNSITACLSKYATFSGRASRSEFWWFYLFTVLMIWAASIVEVVTLGEDGGNFLSTVVSLGFLVPTIAVGARRLHDIGMSGWWQLLMITIVGIIVLIVFWAQETKFEDNKHGGVPEDKQEAGNLAIEAES